MAFRLPEKEIKKRLQEHRNLKNIQYPAALESNRVLREKLKKYEDQEREIEELKQENQTQKLRIEELESMKFGKKRSNAKSPKKTPNPSAPKDKKREASSYTRAIPDPETVTDTIYKTIENCPECGKVLCNKQEHHHYIEDIRSLEEELESKKRIIAVITERGRCANCKGWFSADELPTRDVIIGENVRRFVVYCIISLGMSYSEVLKILKDLYDFQMSEGTIRNILKGEAKLLTPFYDHVLETLENEKKAHYDETSWKTGSAGKEISEGNYAWVKIGIESNYQLFWLGRSRGKQVAEDLRGDFQNSKGVSDDYGAYRNLFEFHQLCWAHPHRKLRDLAESDRLSSHVSLICEEAFVEFRELYHEAQKYRKELDGFSEEQKILKQNILENWFDEITTDHELDPEKLSRIRASLKKNKAKYFTFFEHPELPLDNNKAERALRKLVLKRKKSFGSVSAEAANDLSVLYSVIFSLAAQYPDQSFFHLYLQAATFNEDQ